jgi:hypothetical protein
MVIRIDFDRERLRNIITLNADLVLEINLFIPQQEAVYKFAIFRLSREV